MWLKAGLCKVYSWKDWHSAIHAWILNMPPKTGTDTPWESYRLPHPSVYEATGERIPVDHPCYQTGTVLDAFTLKLFHLSTLVSVNPHVACLSVSVSPSVSFFLLVDRPFSCRAGATLSSCQHGQYGGFIFCPPASPLSTRSHGAAHVW